MTGRWELAGMFNRYLSLSLLLMGCQQTPSVTQTPTPMMVAPKSSELPAPAESKTKFSKVVGWGAQLPQVSDGFQVTRFAQGLVNPRNAVIGPNGDVFVAEANSERSGAAKIKDEVTGKADSERSDASANRITLLRDKDGDGVAEQRHVFLTGLNQPYGMLIVDNRFYVANTDGLWMFAYKPGDVKPGAGKKLLDLPAGGYNNHWTRNLVGRNGKIYISVGSGSNVAENGMENEVRRANILEVNEQGKQETVYASGLRNPVGMAFAPASDLLYTVVNERDELGDELVPDYLTSVQRGGFYGWPFVYFGNHVDPRMKDQKPPQEAIVPDLALGSHTASLGLAFSPFAHKEGVFVGQHGSWNRSELVGYKVVFVPFQAGKPVGPPQDFMSGFISDLGKGEVHGRPAGVTASKDGLLVCDDVGNTVWLVTAANPTKKKPGN